MLQLNVGDLILVKETSFAKTGPLTERIKSFFIFNIRHTFGLQVKVCDCIFVHYNREIHVIEVLAEYITNLLKERSPIHLRDTITLEVTHITKEKMHDNLQ